ncbi:MAG: GNAT family N-acetyltransferase [Promethearchaeota archaeon]|nr:MAG: GNAT family N-acetyltransferase [Candidatus Lokiarchaeota archaeon]
MEIEFYEDVNKFYNLVSDFLLKKEAENNLLFSILDAIKINPKRYGEENPLLIIIKENDKTKLVSLRTPPYNQIFSYTEDIKTIDLLTKELLYRNIELPGVLGFKEGAKRFVQLWCEHKNLSPKLIRNERIYKLEEVAEETLGNRDFIIATVENQPLILKWAKKFILEALPETSEAQIKRSMKHLKNDINDKRFFLLMENREVVSMARKAGKTPNGNLVNLVYTPPNLRRRGYATECVAKLSKHLLEDGNKFCFLFTDLMNPVSNSIYQKIGYRPVIDFDEYKFISE